MPVVCDVEPGCLTKREYHELDYQVMGHAFEVHNELGCLLDEEVYKNAVAIRLADDGHDALTEVLIEIRHGSFRKVLFMDMVVDSSVDYELKAAERLVGWHQRQTLNYMLLSGLSWGKLVNMRPTSVESRYVSTSLRPEDRRDVRFTTSGWRFVTDRCVAVFRHLHELVEDWGLFIDAGLYHEAICHFLGGAEVVAHRLDVVSAGRKLGTHQCHLLDDSTAIHVSAVRNGLEAHERHLRHLLGLTSLRSMQWINFNHRDVTLKTLSL